MKNLKSKKNLIIITLLAVVILGLGGTFAFFTFFKPAEAFILTMDGMETMQVEFQEGTNVIDVPNAYPISDSFAKENISKLGYVDFTVNATTPKKEGLYYELYLTEENGNTLNSDFIKVYLTDDKNVEVKAPTIYSGLSASTSEEHKLDGKILYNETLSGEYTKTFRVYVWIDSTYSQNTEQQTFAFKVNLYAYNTEKPKTVAETIKGQITSHTADGTKLTVEDEDGTIYLSGTNEQINFNYVWYSGKLWRITAINKDDTIKMITQDAITAIAWGADPTYQGSWIYQWLNEDFLDTLENQEKLIVQNAKWNIAEDGNETPVKPSGSTVDGKVGLLNAYEYYQSYKNLGTDSTAYESGYLNIGYYWWLITPYSSLYVRRIFNNGNIGNDLSNYASPSLAAYGVRPSINLKSDILIIGGGGTKKNPYLISGDKEVAKANDKLNSRVSGEYVNFDGKKYRIVGIENETTKLNSVDYVRDDSGVVMTKNFGSNNSWSTSVTSNNDNYWGYYLNNTWYNSINETYKNMLVQGIYYLGKYVSSYKETICSASNTTDRTSECSKTSSTWKNGYVGLPRVGEMFSAMLGNGFTDTITSLWLITPTSSNVHDIGNNGSLYSSHSPSSNTYGVRPSINLNSNVVITSGEGTEQIPFEIKCDSCSLINN